MALPERFELTPDEMEYMAKVLHHHDTCRDLCDDFRYSNGETCRMYRERLRRIWGGPIVKPESPKSMRKDADGNWHEVK